MTAKRGEAIDFLLIRLILLPFSVLISWYFKHVLFYCLRRFKTSKFNVQLHVNIRIKKKNVRF